MGYEYVHDKFARAGLTPLPSTKVAPMRVRECPVHLEARLTAAVGLRAQELFGLTPQVRASTLATIPEEMYLPGRTS